MFDMYVAHSVSTCLYIQICVRLKSLKTLFVICSILFIIMKTIVDHSASHLFLSLSLFSNIQESTGAMPIISNIIQ